jgi:tetratricopeptide (TPR) repeat protein
MLDLDCPSVLGTLLKDAGRWSDAQAAHTNALAITRQLTADRPTHPEFRQELATSHINLGLLLADLGKRAEAEAAYRAALADVPADPAAEVGLARVAAAQRDLAGAARRLGPVAERLPLPPTLELLGDLDQALGRAAQARRQYRLVRVIEQLNRANGVAVDLELARFEADHARDRCAAADGCVGPAGAVALASAALAQRPTVYAEDTLAWALRQAGRPAAALPHARAAVRLGTGDALLWYHLAAVEADLGQVAAARRDLAAALAINAYLSVRDRPAALALAARLGADGRFVHRGQSAGVGRGHDHVELSTSLARSRQMRW